MRYSELMHRQQDQRLQDAENRRPAEPPEDKEDDDARLQQREAERGE